MTYWDTFTSVLKFTIGTGIVGYFARSLFGQYLSRDIERFKAQLTAQHSVEIEQLKADIRAAAFEHETRFVRLHERRIEIVAELYKKLANSEGKFRGVLHPPLQVGGEHHQQRVSEAVGEALEFFEYFEENRIFLDEALCAPITLLQERFRAALVSFIGADLSNSQPSCAEKCNHTFNNFTTDVAPIRREIEKRVREILGVSIDQ